MCVCRYGFGRTCVLGVTRVLARKTFMGFSISVARSIFLGFTAPMARKVLLGFNLPMARTHLTVLDHLRLARSIWSYKSVKHKSQTGFCLKPTDQSVNESQNIQRPFGVIVPVFISLASQSLGTAFLSDSANTFVYLMHSLIDCHEANIYNLIVRGYSLVTTPDIVSGTTPFDISRARRLNCRYAVPTIVSA